GTRRSFCRKQERLIFLGAAVMQHQNKSCSDSIINLSDANPCLDELKGGIRDHAQGCLDI
ncbi:MAG: hypothetical protein MK132_20840, partial [Lentisphaerales bacterium]|nr:hypothetical protein [Lentisphaerales bacterium]